MKRVLLFGTRSGTPSEPAFVITVKGSPSNNFTIPTDGTYTYLYDVEVVGGATHTGKTGDFTVPSLTSGVDYDLKITGTFPKIYFNAVGADKTRILDVKNWGTGTWLDFNSSFQGCTNLVVTATDVPNITVVTSFRRTFYECSSLVSLNFTGWDFSNVVSMNGCFYDNIILTHITGIDTVDLSNNGDVRTMFNDCAVFDQNIGGMRIDSVVNMNINFMTGVTLSPANYEATLLGFLNQQPTAAAWTVTFGNSKFTPTALGYKNTLIGTWGWSITDGGAV